MRRNLLLQQSSEKRTPEGLRPSCRVAAGSKQQLRARNANVSGNLHRSQSGTVLVPIDFAEASHKALEYAVKMATKLNYSVALVHILQRSYVEGFVDANQKEEIRAKARRDARIKLNTLARAKRIPDIPMTCIVSDGLPEYEILRIAEDLRVELIIIGRQDRNPLSRLIFGSVTADVVDAAPCPVLVVHNSGFVPHEIQKDSFIGLGDPPGDDGSHNGN